MAEIDVRTVRFAAERRIAEAKEEIAKMLGAEPSDRLVSQLVAIVEREVEHTHRAYAEYADYLTDRANGWAESGSVTLDV